MRKLLAFATLAIVLALAISIGTLAFQESANSLDLIFIVDSNPDRSTYLDSFKQSMGHLGTATAEQSNVRYGLINLGASQEELDRISQDGFLITSEYDQFAAAMNQLESGTSDLPFDQSLEFIFSSNVSLSVGAHLCLIYISDADLGQISLGDGNELTQQNIIELRLALISSASNPDSNELIGHWPVSALSDNPAQLYQELLSFCAGETATETSQTTQPEVSDNTESSETKGSLDLIASTIESLSERIRVLEVLIEQGGSGAGGTAIEGDVESVLQNHAARIELLDQNVTALSAHLLNVPVLEDLSDKVINQEQLQADLSVSIVLLQDRIVNVEGYSERLASAEQRLDEQHQRLEALGINTDSLLAQITTIASNFDNLPIVDMIARIGTLEQTTSVLGDLEQTIAALQGEQANTISEVESLRQALDSLPMGLLSQQITDLQALHGNEIGQARDQITIINGELANLEVRISANEALIVELESRLSSLPFDELREQLSSLADDLQVQRNTDGAHEVQIAALEQSLADLSELVSRVDNNAARIAPLETLPNRVASLERNHRETSSILATQRTSMEELELSMDDLSSLLAAMRNNIDMLRSDGHAMDLRMTELQTQVLSDRADFGSKLDLAIEALDRARSDLDALQLNSVTRGEFGSATDSIAIDQADQDRWLRELDEQLTYQANEIALIRAVFSDLNEETKVDLLASLDAQNRKLERDVQQLRNTVVYMGTAVALSLVLVFYVLLSR